MDQQENITSSPPEIVRTIFRQGILCTACLEILPSAWVYDQKTARLMRVHQERSRRDLEDSSREGCGFCENLLNIVDQYNLSPGDGGFYLATGTILGQVTINNGDPARYVLLDIIIDLDQQNQGWFVGSHSLSLRSLAFVSRMFNKCREHHGLCGNIEEHPLPKRVLFVGSKSKNTIKLIEGSRKQAHYIALSHCWGKTESIMTTSQNISDHKIGIPWRNLPRVYRDAITFCRELEIQYKWIDSLCIKQDDKDDWAEESSKMASVYENSYLTLAATSARNHDAACASQLAPIHRLAEVGRICLKESFESFLVLARRHLSHPYRMKNTYGGERFQLVSARTDDGRHIMACPLLSRAWVYQERVLSPRVLHFLPDELMWECKSGSECECQGITPNSLESKVFMEEKNFRATERENTRLPHCSGDQGDRYLAGLWESILPDALFWSRGAAASDILPRPEPQTAPTWSWASAYPTQLEGAGWQFCRTCRNDRNRACLIRIENVDVQPATVNPYGAVKANASLVISGTITSGFLRHSQSGHTFVIPGIITEIQFEPDYDFEHPGQYCIPQGSELVCLYQNCHLWDEMEESIDDTLLSGLILKDIGEGRYERIGFVPARYARSEESAIFQQSTLTLV
ncbi:heterokaryon incompatibility protein-domain-containing protein [Xylaria venustula]|nr:heterokaryon incompatibility protein-domain-containing protein [Xylaria venustula]